MEKKDKRMIGYLLLAAVLLLVVMNPQLILAAIGYIGDFAMPVLVGFVIAFIMNVPVIGFEKLFGRLFGKTESRKKLYHSLSVTLSLVSVVLVIVLMSVIVIPELIRTVNSLINVVEEQWPTWMTTLESHNVDTGNLRTWFTDINWESMFSQASGYAGSVIGSVAGMATSTLSGFVLAVTAIVVAVYMMLDRDKLASQTTRLLRVYTKPKFAERAIRIGRMIRDAYIRFLTGQCIDSLLLGVMIFIVFSIVGLPYPALNAVFSTICSLVPYVGAFVSCVLAVLLALVVSPAKALLCLIVYLVIQFIETQIIYPRVVGGSVGLSPLWTLVAVIVGGKLFGIFGMIFFIPIVSVAYDLLKEHTNNRQKQQAADAALQEEPPANTPDDST